MGKSKKLEENLDRKFMPALTPDAQENRMISLAMDRAEEQLRDGTASSQLITHFLKLASSKERLEMEKLRRENELLKAKTDDIRAQKDMKDMYLRAINSMRRYSGLDVEEEYDEFED